jgi:hypothetical protein
MTAPTLFSGLTISQKPGIQSPNTSLNTSVDAQKQGLPSIFLGLDLKAQSSAEQTKPPA